MLELLILILSLVLMEIFLSTPVPQERYGYGQVLSSHSKENFLSQINVTNAQLKLK